MRASWSLRLLMLLVIGVEFSFMLGFRWKRSKDPNLVVERPFRVEYNLNLLGQILQQQQTAAGIALGFSPEFTPAGLYVAHNMVTHLPDKWAVVLVTKRGKNITEQMLLLDEMMQAIPPNRKKKRTLILAPILTANFNRPSYSCLLVSKALYEAVPTEQILIFQEDTFVLRKDDGHKDVNETRFKYLRDFFQFPYIGAPWIWRNCQEKWNSDKLCRDSGNGGLSLRNKYAMINITKQIPIPTRASCLSEDLVITSYLDISPYFPFLPPRSVGRQFSVETIPSKDPWGVHKPWRFPQWVSSTPELLLLQKFQKGSNMDLSIFYWWIKEQGLSEDYFRRFLSISSTSPRKIKEAIQKNTNFSTFMQSRKKRYTEMAPDEVYLNHRGNAAFATSWWNNNRYKQTKEASIMGNAIMRHR